nr:PTS transporter subunit EIIB [uncultured Catenibacterium sp.]
MSKGKVLCMTRLRVTVNDVNKVADVDA